MLERLPAPHILQTWEWGEVKERYGWRGTRWLWGTPGRPQAAALILTRRTRTPFGVMYVPKGPLLDYDDIPLLNRVLGDLEEAARRERALFIKLDPDVRTDTPQGEAVVSTLRHRGWRASSENIQFRNTLFLDLTPSLDDIMAGMKSKWRYNIRLAARKGVQVRAGGADDLVLLYRMYQETSQRNRFPIRPEGYYLDVWGTFIRAGMAQPLIAEVEGEPVAMLILFYLHDRAWYLYGASRSVHRDRMPNHLLQWEAIRRAKERGCTVYDLWGAPDRLDESDPMWGVYLFKRGFGAELVRHIGAYDYAPSLALYWLYGVVMPRWLGLMRWRYWTRRSL